jgi:hypothetical protein
MRGTATRSKVSCLSPNTALQTANINIERWLHEFPKNNRLIDVDKIRPPYRSTEIPIAENSGFNSVGFSIRTKRIYAAC